MILDYTEFTDLLNEKFSVGLDLIVEVLNKVIKDPNRFTGIYRISNAKTKLIQNITQSHEIKFGDFMEELITIYLSKIGYKNLPKRLGVNKNNESLNADQLFEDKYGALYLVEQKIRDDHDSTKKRGQIQNFEKKVNLLKSRYPNKEIIAVMWFIDDGLKKNKIYYIDEAKKIKYANTSVSILYGDEFFETIIKKIEPWNEIKEYLKMNKLSRADEILTLPDFGNDQIVLDALNSLSKNLIGKLLSTKPEFVQLRNELFSSGNNLDKIKRK